jgi:hypothetical protein
LCAGAAAGGPTCRYPGARSFALLPGRLRAAGVGSRVRSSCALELAPAPLDHQPRLTFQRVPEPKTGKVRIHLDIQVDDIGAARQRVEDLGGRWSGERHDYDDGIVIVMHDPENHEFCLVQYYD